MWLPPYAKYARRPAYTILGSIHFAIRLPILREIMALVNFLAPESISWGDFAKPMGNLSQFKNARVRIIAITAFPISPNDLDLPAGDPFCAATFGADAAHLGDCIDGTWGIFVRGNLDPACYFLANRNRYAL